MSSQRPVLCGALSLCLFAPVLAVAQTWVPPKGEGYASLSYQGFWMRHHLDSFGRKSAGGVRSHVAVMGFTYGLTDRLAFDADMPWVASKYSGPVPFIPEMRPGGGFVHPFIDDSRYHGAFQDLRLNVRYNVLRDPVVLTSGLAVVIPSQRYPTFGHANLGRDLREYRAAIHLARQLRPFLPRAYVDLVSTYTFVQKLVDINTNRHNIGLEVGYFLMPRLLLRGFGVWQKTHGGLERSPNFPIELLSMQYRLWRAHWSRLGGGALFSVNENIDLFAAVTSAVSGKNAETGTYLAFGISWRFKKGAVEEMAPGALESSASNLKSMREAGAGTGGQRLGPSVARLAPRPPF